MNQIFSKVRTHACISDGAAFLCFALVAVIGMSNAQAAHTPMKKSPSADKMAEAILNNEAQSHYFRSFEPLAGVAATVRPFADYEKAGYVFISDAFEFDSRAAKEAIAANLPKDMTLVVFMEDTSSARGGPADFFRKISAGKSAQADFFS